MTSVLVIDDEPGIVRFLRRALEAAGYGVHTATDGVDGLRQATETRFDIITLDLLLPRLCGMAVLSALRAQDPAAKVIVLSAVGGVRERVQCLEAGAADYVIKPFAVSELLARIHARLDMGQSGGSPELSVGDVRLDPGRRIATVGREAVELSSREYLVMAHLMAKAGKAVSRQELLSDVWGLSFDPGSNVVDVCVARLRAKIDGDRIETIRNVGYSFRSA